MAKINGKIFENMLKNVAIVSLSKGLLGEDFVSHEVEIGLKRLCDYGLHVKFMPNATKGITYLQAHPEKRAEDLLAAFADESIDMILCAIGGDDTYRLLPYLFENHALKNALSQKIFLGFSDTTLNHLMLYKLGLKTFYGQSFISDICELDETMLPYSAKYFEELIKTGSISEIRPSKLWYEERTDFSAAAIGTPRVCHENTGFELLQGAAQFRGEILGGCLETLYDIFDSTRHSDSVELCKKYQLFPSLEEWTGKILLLETSEEMPAPEKYRKMLEKLRETGIFKVVSAVLCGKPMDERYAKEYKRIIVELVDNPSLPIVANVNVGHATPRCIVPFGVEASVDIENQVIRFVQS